MRVLFVDIDGVLNSITSKSRCDGFIGIDNSKVKLLKEIIDKTNAKIVLVSIWKSHWEKDYTLICHHDAKYLNNKFRKQNLFIFDKTKDNNSNRGEGIYNWIKEHNVSNWAVLDDEIFDDYEKYGILDHLVKTEFYDKNGGGLQKNHVEKAIKILNGEIK